MKSSLGFAATVITIAASETSAFQIQPHQICANSMFHSPAFRITTLSAVVNIDENAPRDITTMDEWANACGVERAEGFQLAVSEGTDGPGLDVFAMASQDIPSNSPVLFVPSQMILSSNRAVEELGGREMRPAEKLVKSLKSSDQLRQYYLMLKILVEWERGDDSPWFPWLNSLPRYFSNAASMTPFCYKCLPSLMASLAMKERANMNNLLVRRVPFLSDETKSNTDLWEWAYQIVYTRSFETNNGSGDLCIAPMADMFNHETETEVELAYDDEGNCYVQTTRDVPARSPLRMSYGDPTNPSFLFARYGFLDESSPATFCKIIPQHISKELIDMGYAHNRMLFYKDTGEASQEVWDVLLYQILSSSNAARKRELYNAHMEGDYETKQLLHQQFYPETSARLLEHIDTFLYQLDELSAKAAGRDFREHPRLPLILRHNEFVRNTFVAVRAQYFGQ
eukprot:CAMPEP_0113545714 /NCGR_PEP_ID=MMETSP0015_2-20120614/11415_1 /TAXON_ID=2838 /ORGANISM="Odontella" /LENGTH=453 /DNA_ID=CAMNT_0000446111 /DNA_START=144 /DNA_END=1505 /DNA_ORIENTATION=- /assembly_acc=CAM_ASM_000160